MKPNIFLDLDQTIISSVEISDFDFDKYDKKLQKFTYYIDGYYIIFERPNLQKFLDKLFKEFNVSVWTAASKNYALFIIEKFILNKEGRKLDWIFFNYHCNLSEKLTNHTKSLKMLWEEYKFPEYNKNNTFIIDDYDEVYNSQKNNCIIAKPFEFKDDNSEDDDFLKLLKNKLDELKYKIINNKKNPNKFINNKK